MSFIPGAWCLVYGVLLLCVCVYNILWNSIQVGNQVNFITILPCQLKIETLQVMQTCIRFHLDSFPAYDFELKEGATK